MKKLKKLIIAVFLVLFAAGILFLPNVTTAAIRDSLHICAASVLPSLFPFFVFTNLWITLGYAQKMSALVAPVMERIFRLPGEAASALILGVIGGYPTGAQTILGLYQKKLISKDEAERMLLFCNNSGPAFAVAVIGGQYFHSAAVGVSLYLVHVCSACLIGMLFRSSDIRAARSASNCAAAPFLPALTDSIRRAGQTTFQVCVFITFFSLLTAMIQAVTPSEIQSGDAFRLLIGSLEMVKGSSDAAGWSWPFSVCAAAFYLGWGGLCIHCQTLSILHEARLKTGKYFMGKLIHGGISALLMGCLLRLLPAVRPAWSSERIGTLTLCQILCLLMAGLILIGFLKKTSGNRAKERV